MALVPGDQVGPYEILAPLGEGGMGAVYRARDTRLRREVALKIILDAAARDADSLARFERETRAVAALDHPNIVSIHDTGIHEGTPYAVTELLEGETLAERLSEGALDPKRSVEIAGQVADGLAAAHAKGIVHRDIKPQNIFLTSDGRAKILDFGIAHVGRPDGDLRESFATTASAVVGEVAGTVGYMSPEQVRGKQVDGRSDIFALGAVLFEMLTGHKAFGRDTPIDTLGAILTDRPETHREAEKIPADLRRLAVRCLEKEPSDRYQSARDLALDLRAWQAGALGSAPRSEAPAARAGPRTPLAALIGAVLFAAGLFFGTRLRSRPPAVPRGPTTRVTLSLSPPLSLAESGWPAFAISPDGEHLVYCADSGGVRRLAVRDLDALESRLLPGTDDANGPFFSPDNRWVGFMAPGELRKILLTGGTPVALGPISPVTRGTSWGPNETIVLSPNNTGGLDRRSAATGEANAIVTPDYGRGEHAYRWPQVLPGGKAVLFAAYGGGDRFDAASIVALRLDTGEKKTLVRGGTGPHYAATGHLVFARGGSLLAAPMDADRLEVTGPAVAVLSGVRTEGDGAAQFDLSSNGTLAYLRGPSPAVTNWPIVSVDRRGQSRILRSDEFFLGPRFSPDGRRFAFSKGDANQDVWVADLDRDTTTRFTPEASEEFGPVWSPDGKRIAYGSERRAVLPQIYVRSADGSGAEALLWGGKNAAFAQSWSPDGRTIAIVDENRPNGWDIWTLTLGEQTEARPFLATPHSEAQPDFSPDGHWIAYASDESGRFEVYARPHPGPGARIQVSNDGGTEPVWARDGREIFYRNGNRMMAVPVRLGSALAAGRPLTLFEKPGFYADPAMQGRNYDVAPDGRSFLMLKAGEPSVLSSALILVTNWFAELERKVGAGAK